MNDSFRALINFSNINLTSPEGVASVNAGWSPAF